MDFAQNVSHSSTVGPYTGFQIVPAHSYPVSSGGKHLCSESKVASLLMFYVGVNLMMYIEIPMGFFFLSATALHVPRYLDTLLETLRLI